MKRFINQSLHRITMNDGQEIPRNLSERLRNESLCFLADELRNSNIIIGRFNLPGIQSIEEAQIGPYGLYKRRFLLGNKIIATIMFSPDGFRVWLGYPGYHGFPKKEREFQAIRYVIKKHNEKYKDVNWEAHLTQ